MPATQRKRTAELIEDARETSRRTRAILDDLIRVTQDVRETVRYSRWCRFLDFDIKSIEFIDKLDSNH